LKKDSVTSDASSEPSLDAVLQIEEEQSLKSEVLHHRDTKRSNFVGNKNSVKEECTMSNALGEGGTTSALIVTSECKSSFGHRAAKIKALVQESALENANPDKGLTPENPHVLNLESHWHQFKPTSPQIVSKSWCVDHPGPS
jgi:hypothetical protein